MLKGVETAAKSSSESTQPVQVTRDDNGRINGLIADKLREVADLLHAQAANPFRVAAYRHAAEAVAGLKNSIRAVFEREGIEGLDKIPAIGKGIASAIAELLITGRWMQLERLRGAADPVALFQTVPGIGPKLAAQIHETLHVDTLEALETAALEGRLDEIRGLGARRAASIRASLSTMLGRVRGPADRRKTAHTNGPSVATLLEIDREYLRAAAAGTLEAIAPKRFNPRGEKWLPVLHTERDGWHFTAMFSNTARAHELGRTHDWVVIYYYDDDQFESQVTVVTEARGPLGGKRVIRGKEAECRKHYDSLPTASVSRRAVGGNGART